jgi:bifunctional aspartokinase / homoserine dehydrogenase 1
MPASRLVIKFGGTSVGSGHAIAQAAAIAAELRGLGHPLVVVTSAMSGVTDALLAAAAAAVRGERHRLRELAETLRARHHAAAAELVHAPDEHHIVLDPIDQRLAEFSMLCDALMVLGEASPRALDALSSLGERMSVHLLAGALRARGTAALPVDASEIVRTDDSFQAAAPDMPETRRLTQEMLSPLLAEGIVPVVTGFVGATEDGVVTTLGRGGSDYSAAIVGAALDADEVWIYTDVDGVMTADPRVVPDVRTLETLSYREMSELA